MTSLSGGYNINQSLLPASGGEIKPMSGGGYNIIPTDPQISLLPKNDPSFPIKSFNGGATTDPITFRRYTSYKLSGGTKSSSTVSPNTSSEAAASTASEIAIPKDPE